MTSAKTCKLCTFLKIIKEKPSGYLFNIVPKNNSNHRTRNSYNIPQFNIKHNFFKNSFFPSVIVEWNKPDWDTQNLNSLSLFKSRILKFIQPNPNSILNCHNPKTIKYLSRIRLGLSHLHEHKFKHSFQDIKSYLCLWIRYWNTLSLPHLLPCPWCWTKYSPEQHKTNCP